MHVFTETKSIYKYMHAYYTTTYIIYIYCPEHVLGIIIALELSSIQL